jgi:hypothetical protein
MMYLSFVGNKKSFFLYLSLVIANHTHTMDIIKSGFKSGIAMLPGLVLLEAKYISGNWIPSIIITCLGSERLTNFTTYAPGYKTQAAMLGISFFTNWLLFYKQKALFEHPGVYDRQSAPTSIATSSSLLDKGGCTGQARKWEDWWSYFDRPGLLGMGIVEFFILCGFSCTVLACQKNLNGKTIQYSALCAFMNVAPSLIWLLLKTPPQKDNLNVNPT